MNKRLVGAITIGVSILVAGGFVFSCLEKVPAGYSGVVYSFNGGVTGEVLGQGLHFLSPFERVAKYPVSTETMYLAKGEEEGGKNDNSFEISTKDGKMVDVDVELSYHYEHERLDDVYTKWRGKSPKEIEDTYIRARVKAVANEVTSTYAVMDVYGEKRTELNQKVFKQLSEILSKDGILLETFNFTRIEPDPKTQEAIQAKVDAQQKLEQDKIEAERQAVTNQKNIDIKKAEAEQARIEAEAKAERMEISAKAEAEAIRIKAEAEAEANKKLGESLNDKLLTLKKYQKWDGSQPQVQGSSTPIINLN